MTLQASDFLSTRQNRKIINFGHAPDEYRKKKKSQSSSLLSVSRKLRMLHKNVLIVLNLLDTSKILQ